MCNLVSHIKGGMYTEDVSEQGAERDIRLTTGREGAREGDEWRLRSKDLQHILNVQAL